MPTSGTKVASSWAAGADSAIAGKPSFSRSMIIQSHSLGKLGGRDPDRKRAAPQDHRVVFPEVDVGRDQVLLVADVALETTEVDSIVDAVGCRRQVDGDIQPWVHIEAGKGQSALAAGAGNDRCDAGAGVSILAGEDPAGYRDGSPCGRAAGGRVAPDLA